MISCKKCGTELAEVNCQNLESYFLCYGYDQELDAYVLVIKDRIEVVDYGSFYCPECFQNLNQDYEEDKDGRIKFKGGDTG